MKWDYLTTNLTRSFIFRKRETIPTILERNWRESRGKEARSFARPNGKSTRATRDALFLLRISLLIFHCGSGWPGIESAGARAGDLNARIWYAHSPVVETILMIDAKTATLWSYDFNKRLYPRKLSSKRLRSRDYRVPKISSSRVERLVKPYT